MVYCETIEESKIWVCPKAGVWKIICIGGGGAGAALGATSAFGTDGGTTSFGSYISANGGKNGKEYIGGNNPLLISEPYAGINGFNGASTYGVSSGNVVGCGYGGSGGATSTNLKYCCAGFPGEVKSTIVDIIEDTSIPCTIGTGGASANDNQNQQFAFPGKSGAIIVQYLGSEM